jgi:hypothetical protein
MAHWEAGVRGVTPQTGYQPYHCTASTSFRSWPIAPGPAPGASLSPSFAFGFPQGDGPRVARKYHEWIWCAVTQASVVELSLESHDDFMHLRFMKEH